MTRLRGLVAATGAAIGLLAASAQALPPVLDRVPTDALVVITTPSLDRLQRSSTALTTALNLPMPIPNLQDMLAMGGFGEGVDTTKSMAAVIMSGDMESDTPPMAILIPVTNYAGLLGNFGGNATAGVDEVMIQGEPAFFRDIGGGYALMSPLKELAQSFTAKAGNAAAHRAALGKTNQAIADASDLIIIANVQGIRPLAEPQIGEMFEGMIANSPLGMMGGDGPDLAGAEAMVTSFLQQGRTAVIGIKADGAGLSIDLGAQFIDGSFLAQTFAQGGDAGSLMRNLPKQPYYFAIAADLATPGMKQIAKNMMESGRQQAEAAAGDAPPPGMFMLQPEDIDGAAFVVGASPGVMMGSGVLINTVSYMKTSDPEAYIAKMRTAMDELDGAEFEGMSYATSYAESATTVNGTAVDSWEVKIDGDMADPMAGQAMAMIFGGAGGPGGYIAKTNGGVVQTFSKNSVLMGEALKVAKDPSAGLASEASLSQVAERLPANRLVEGYIGMKSILDMAKMIGPMLGAPPMNVPAALPPVGFAMAGGDGASRMTLFVPTPVLRTTSEIAQAFQQAGAGGQEDGPAPENRTGQPRF